MTADTASQTRRALITGAAGGIGRALVDAFADAGYAVVATDRLAAPPGMRCHAYLQLDLAQFVRDEGFAARALDEMRAALGGGPLHALVNNAALQVLGGLSTLTRADWHSTLDVNLLAPFLLTQGLRQQLLAAPGAVVNVSSIHARLSKRDFVAYATSKAALSGMTRALALDVGARIRVNAIEPAAIETEMLKAGFATRPEQYEKLRACHPAGRIGQPAEVAALALALADGRFAFAHGACLQLDGGIGASLHDPAD